MIIDCGTCVVRGDACADCVVTVLLGPPALAAAGEAGEAAQWYVDDAEVAALAVLAGSGLVPPLRLVPASESDPGPEPGRPRRRRTA